MTILDQPHDLYSVNSPLVYTVYDANSIDPTKENYKYVAEIYISTTKVFVMKAFPDTTNNFGIFDVAGVVREYVNAYFKEELGAGEFWIDIKIDLKEEYNGAIINEVVANSDRIYVFNHYNARINEFTKLDEYENKPLTDRPNTINLLQNSNFFYIPYFARSGNPFDVTIDGTTTTITPTDANNLIHINIALGVIAGYDYDVVIDGTTFNVKTICSGLYDNYQIHFLNKWGGFETMLFNKASKKNYEVEKKHYTQQPYRINSSGEISVFDAISPNKMHEQETTFASKFKEKLRISTDWLSDEEYKWLYQLIVSPMVYLYDFSGGAFYPVQIINTNYEVNKHIQDNLTNLTIEVEFGTTYKTQFR